MKVDLTFFIYCSIFLTVAGIISGSDAVSSSSSSLYLRSNTDSNDNTIVNINDNNIKNDRSLQIDEAIRTDLVRLIPFDVQIAIEDDSSTGGDDLVSETLYKNGGSLLRDIITDWMMESFETKTINQNNYNMNNKQNQLVNNNTSFDSIALELIDEKNSIEMINGQELNLIQVSFEGVSLWERIGTGTPPMEPEIVELIQRATFLEDRKLKEDLQSVVSNLLIDLGIDTEDDQQPSITIVDVRAYITPPFANNNSDGNNNNNDNINNGEQQSATDGNSSNNSNSSSNENLEIIIIVAIVVACLAFVLLMFAVVWAWRSDRRDYDEKPSSSSQGGGVAGSQQQPKSSSSMSKKQLQQQRKSKRSSSNKSATSNSSSNNNNNNKSKKRGMMNRKSNVNQKRSGGRQNSEKNDNAVAEGGGGIDTSGAANFPDILNNGSYPKEIGNINNGYANNGQGGSGTNNNQYPDSVISEDISTSLSAYYKSGMAYNAVGAPKHLSNGGEINDAASMSSMDSYGYSLDGYAPSLGPAQGGYPVGPLQAAKDLPVPIGDSSDAMDIVQLQQEVEEPEDYDAETPVKDAADADNADADDYNEA